MAFKGITYITKRGSAVKSLNGFYGIKITLSVISVKITDFRDKGLGNVEVTALNPTSGIPFTGFTDSLGSVYMELDINTEIVIKKNQIIKTVQYSGQASPTYTIDLPFIQNN